MCTCFSKCYRGLIALGTALQPIFLLAVRLFWGWQFFKAGLGKFSDMEGLASYFQTLSIPFPLLSAYLAGTTEMVGGLFLLIGFVSRLVAIPLIFTMLVALLTANYDVTSMIFDDPVSVTNLSAFTFLLASTIILVFGPGFFSVDHAIKMEN
jgi:putative oxidoreductase